MSEKLLPNRVSFSYSDIPDLMERIGRFSAKHGYHLELAQAEQMTVKDLAARVGRPVNGVSRDLHDPRCPISSVTYGKGQRRKRITQIAATPRLVKWLAQKKQV